jgi:hypothetical protein
MALAFGVLIVVLLMAGSLWITANLNHNVLPMDQLMRISARRTLIFNIWPGLTRR